MALRKRTMSDSVGLRMLYVEAVYYVLKGWYPTSQQEAVRLGGLQLQAYLGDAGAAHVPGFLTSDNSWKNYVPKHLHHAGSPQQWEAVCLIAAFFFIPFLIIFDGRCCLQNIPSIVERHMISV